MPCVFAIWMKLIQVFKPRTFMILNIVSCNEISLGQKCKKKETELDGMVFKGAPSLGCPISSR